MQVNATLLVQILVFVVFIWVTMRFIWPPLMKALNDRQKNIADGLAAAEKGHETLASSQVEAKQIIAQAKQESVVIVEQANRRGGYIVDEAKSQARQEADHILEQAQRDIKQAYHVAQEKLLKEMSAIALVGTEKIIGQYFDQASNDRLVDAMVREK